MHSGDSIHDYGKNTGECDEEYCGTIAEAEPDYGRGTQAMIGTCRSESISGSNNCIATLE